MNIRSMIKHVAAIITAVGMLLASMAGAVTALAEDSKPTTAVDGPTKPVRIMDNLYQTRYTGDYKLDDYLSANAGGNDDYLAWLRANLNHGKPIPLSTTQACTTLAVTGADLYAVWKRVKTEPTPVPTLPQTGGMLGLIGGLVAVILLTGAGITWRLRRR